MLDMFLINFGTTAGHLTALLIRETIEVLIEVPEWI